MVSGSYAAFGPTITSANASMEVENPYNVIGGGRHTDINVTWGKENTATGEGFGNPPPPHDESSNVVVDDPYETIEEVTSKLNMYSSPRGGNNAMTSPRGAVTSKKLNEQSPSGSGALNGSGGLLCFVSKIFYLIFRYFNTVILVIL